MKRAFPLVPLLAALLCAAPLGCDALGGDDASSDDDGGKKKKKKKDDDGDDEDEVEIGDDGLPRLKDGSIPAPKKGQWKPPKMGSYVLLEPAKPDPKAPTFKNSWLKKRNDNEYLVQSEVKMMPMPMVVQAWVKVVDLKAITEDNIKLLELKAKMGGAPPRTFPVGSNPMFDRMLDQFIAAVQPAKLDGMPQEDVKTPVGLFRGAYKVKRTMTAMGVTGTSTIYLHPTVTAGAIRIESDTWTVHLTEVDDDGAEAVF